MERKRLVRSPSVLSCSRERASATWFFSPSNHCEYSLISPLMNMEAWCLAMSILVAASRGSASSPCSLKFVLRIHPADVVLSVIDSAQSPLFKRFARMSIHGLIIDAMNSSRLFEALKRKPGCSSNLQAKPSSEKESSRRCPLSRVRTIGR